jgi:hypothetical protein
MSANQPLSALFRDPFIAAAFRRAERDAGHASAVPSPVAPRLNGGAAESIARAKPATELIPA